MEILFFLLWGCGGWGAVFKMTSLLCKSVSVADGYILLFSDQFAREKVARPPPP